MIKDEAWDTKNKPQHKSFIMLKFLKFNKKNSLNNLEIILNRRKFTQKNEKAVVKNIISNVKKKRR